MLVSKLPGVGTTIFTVMSELANTLGALNLSQGFPDYDAPADLIESAAQAMRSGKNQYAPMAGVLPLREAIAAKYASMFNVEFDPVTEVTITPGATVALFTALAAIVQSGDEVIVFEPAYDSYGPAIQVLGGVPVFVQLNAPSYQPDWDEVRSKISKRTKAVIVNSPHNPTGTVWGATDHAILTELCTQNDLYVISDEVYELITYGEPHVPLASIPELRDRTFTITSFGKTFHVTGWKVGACAAALPLMNEFRKVHQFLSFCVNTPIQHGIATYMQNPHSYRGLADFFNRKRNVFLEGLAGSKWTVRPCSGSYFQLLGYENISDLPDTEMAVHIAHTCKVASIPLSPFTRGEQLDRALRFCFAKNDSTLIEAARRLTS